MVIKLSQQYNAPAAEVFRAYTDASTLPEIIPGIDKVQLLEGGSLGEVGAKWVETRTMWGKQATETMWVSAAEENKKYVVDADSNGVKYVTTHTFSEQDGVTTVDIEFDAQPQTIAGKFFSVFNFVMAGSIKSMLQADMDAIKEYVEAN